jgi:adenine specific DNA methylase Mod
MKQPTTQEFEKVAEDVIKCNASEWLTFALNRTLRRKMTLLEQAAIKRAEERNFMILPGMPYIEEKGVYMDKPYTSAYIKEIHEICLKYELYSYTGNKSKIK